MSASIKPPHVSVFSATILRGSRAVLCAVTVPPADLRSLSSYYYVVCGRMCVSSVYVWCSSEHQTRTDDMHMRPHTA
jgi:hypothetical protein